MAIDEPPLPKGGRAIFSRRATTIARIVPAVIVGLAVALPVVAMIWVRTPTARGEGLRIKQPIPFNHVIHAHDLKIDCRFCHSGVDHAASAGFPTTERCVVCHSSTMLATDEFKPVRQSLRTGHPIPWRRVTQLPGFVYFNHAMHVTRGVPCQTCHGRVDQMPVVHQAVPLTMHWCVTCHRNPEPHLRPLSQVTAMGLTPLSSDSVMHLAKVYHVKHLTNCTTCHR